MARQGVLGRNASADSKADDIFASGALPSRSTSQSARILLSRTPLVGDAG
jgi:hypothetical protein